jgi:TolB-like protein/Tfp pilus assembly protein PilF
MKRCPECRRDYVDDTLLYCLEDGVALVQGSVASYDEPQTAILNDTAGVNEAATRSQIYATDQTEVLPSGTIEVSRNGFDKRLLLVPIALVLIVFGGFFGYRYLNSPSNEINSVAVLPFENRSGNGDAEYLSDGLADSLIYRLSQLPNLKVSPTSSVMRYKGKETDIAQIAKELEVDAVMSGRLVQRADDLTINVELIDTRTRKLLWVQQYDRKMTDLLATQREIAAAIAQKLQLNLFGNDIKGITKRYTDNNDAYQLSLKGRFHFERRTKDDVLKSIDYYEQAIMLDPGFALAYARIAEAYNQMPAYPYLPPNEACPRAKAAAKRGLEIDPTLADAHAALANTLVIYDWNWPEAEIEFKRALELDPNSAATHFRYGLSLGGVGRLEEGIAEVKRAVELEPLDLSMNANLAWAYFTARQFDSAFDQAKKAHALDNNHVVGRWNLSQAYIAKGMYAEAIALNENSLKANPTSQSALRDTGFAYAKTGRRREAEEMISRLSEIAKTNYVMHCRIASIYGALGEKDKAFAELERAFAERDWDLHRLKVDPFMDPLRDDPRFNELLRKIGLPQ